MSFVRFLGQIVKSINVTNVVKKRYGCTKFSFFLSKITFLSVKPQMNQLLKQQTCLLLRIICIQISICENM